MAIAVLSTSTATSSNADSLTITKPTGVSVGDTLFLIASGQGGHPACTGFTSLLTPSYDGGGAIDAYVNILYRIADSSDVSASNYSVTLSGANTLGSAVMLRTSGWVSGNPLFASATKGDSVDSASYTVDSGTISLSRPSQQLLILAGHHFSEDNNADYSNYTLVSADSNPTWIEVIDSDYTTQANTYDNSFFVAYALSSNTSTITGYTIDVSSATSGGADSYITALAVICSPLSQTVSNATFAVSPVTFSTLTASTQEPENDFHEVSPNFPEQSGVVRNPTVWTNPDKPSTTYTNTLKP